MKIKILLAGDNDSRASFLKSLGKDVTFKQANASINIVGTGIYTFRLDNDDIEILYIENTPLLQKNYAKYAVGAKAIIFVDADEETQKLLREACPKHTPVAKNTSGKEVNGLAGVKLAVKKCYQRQTKLSANPHTQFKSNNVAAMRREINNSRPAAQGVDLDLLKKFLAERSPVRK